MSLIDDRPHSKPDWLRPYGVARETRPGKEAQARRVPAALASQRPMQPLAPASRTARVEEVGFVVRFIHWCLLDCPAQRPHPRHRTSDAMTVDVSAYRPTY